MLDLEKLRSINQGGKTRGLARIRRNGANREIDYADGSVEAVVRPAPVHITRSVSTGKVSLEPTR